jgi:hypothetical protein
MPRDRTQHPTPDLFSEASAPEPPPTPASQVSSPKAAAVDMAAPSRRYLLPKDLPNALKRLDDGELASLLAAALDEAKRRGKLASGLAASAWDDPTPRGSRERDESSKVRPAHAVLSLTRGQVNAVRAAFKAGIAPPRIAREFGISQSEVRNVLASDARQRGRES